MHKAIEIEIKSGGDGTIEGYAPLFDTVDSYGDSVDHGAFDATLADWKRKGRLPAMLWSHNQAEPIGAWTAITADAKGLHVRGRLAAKGRAAEVRELLDMQAVDGASIGYLPIVEDFREGVNHLREVRLFEVSLCVIPALSEARVASLKSFDTVRGAEQALRDVAALSRRDAEQFILRVRELRESGKGFDDAAVMATLRHGALRLPSEFD
ncbi:HK97 family phage prohead protease [Paraburkholderia metrosideri]|uniref:Prohead serine protease domain-containing protein n=1 Tax=Paraburkholderia metrosideri TaxID=580937 RepID=A0ABM8P1L6_9BURK|nr:HK97 family phage prohead protease [Paraburkholderia metrosideri]CAD6553503.1 hypothetical protein LMG28140_05308 [Paraburkholderia metrosideri]